MTSPPIGHNSGFEGYWELRRAIWDSKEPLIVKALALAILEHMRPDKLEAWPSRRSLAAMCSISENTLERHWTAISQWIDIIKERGKKNVYRARIYACASELIYLVPNKPPQAVGGGFAKVPTTNHPTERVPPTQSTPQRGGESTPHVGGSEDLIEDTRGKRVFAPKAINEASGRTWAKRDPFGLNPWQAKQHDDVKFDDEFRIEVHNGFETELLQTIAPAGLDLRGVLDEAARWIPRSAPPSELKVALRSQVSRQVREAKERAEARAARSPQAARGSPSDEPDWARDKREQRENSKLISKKKSEIFAKYREQK